MFVGRTTKIAATAAALLFGLGALMLLFNYTKALADSGPGYDLEVVLFNLIGMAVSFVFAVMGFYFARDLKNSWDTRKPPEIGKVTWFASAASFALFSLGVFIAFASFASGLLNGNYSTSDLGFVLMYSFFLVASAVAAKVCVNNALELELFEPATPELVKRIFKRKGNKRKRGK